MCTFSINLISFLFFADDQKMSDCETNSDDSKDSNAGPVPQFLVVNNINNISMLNGDNILYE
jgi:hypothetical protein